MSSTGKKLVRGSAMRLIAKFINMAVGLFMMPIIIRTLGDRHYGIWVLVATYLGFTGLFDLGITSAVSRFLSRALGAEDEEDFRSFFATSVWLLSGLGFVLLVLSLIMAMCSNLIVNDPADAHLFRWLAVILGVSMAVQFPTRVFNAVLGSHLRFDLSSAVRTSEAIVRAPLVLLAFYLDYRLLGLAVVSAGVELLAAGCFILMALKTHKGLSFSRKLVGKKRARQLFGYGFYTLIAQVAELLKNQISPIIITVFSGVVLVAPFAIANRLNRIVTEMMVAFMNVLAPVFSRQDGRGDTNAIRKAYLFTCKISTYISVLFGGLMMILGKAFIERWLGAEYIYVVPFMQVLMIGNIFACAQIPTVSFLYGTSRNKYYAFTNIIHGIACAGLSAALIIPFGLMGVAIGVAIPTVVIKFFVQPIYACRALEISLMQFYLKHALVNFIVPIAYLVAVYFVTQSLVKPQYLYVFSIAILCSFLFVPYVSLFIVGDERQKLIHAIMPKRGIVISA